MNDYIKTSDLYLVATLGYFGFPIDSVEKEEEKVSFLIRRDDRAEEILEAYWKHEVRLDPLLFSAHLKEVKGRVYASIR